MIEYVVALSSPVLISSISTSGCWPTMISQVVKRLRSPPLIPRASVDPTCVCRQAHRQVCKQASDQVRNRMGARRRGQHSTGSEFMLQDGSGARACAVWANPSRRMEIWGKSCLEMICRRPQQSGSTVGTCIASSQRGEQPEPPHRTGTPLPSHPVPATCLQQRQPRCLGPPPLPRLYCCQLQHRRHAAAPAPAAAAPAPTAPERRPGSAAPPRRSSGRQSPPFPPRSGLQQ